MKVLLSEADLKRLRVLFLKYLTVDSETNDARSEEFNLAVFDVFDGTDLDMVMEKFDKATRELKKEVLNE